MDTARVLIAMGSETSNAKIKAFMIENGYDILEQAVEGHECLRKIRTLKPDLLILDGALPSLGGYDVAKVALEDDLCDVIMIYAQGQEELRGDFNEFCEFAGLQKPLNKVLLLKTVELMVKSKKRIKKLEKELETLRSTIDSRKEVDKAKNLLMEHLSMSEQEAFKRIQKQSMDKGMPMKDIAKAIILAYDI